jgi:hypothetical protein
MGNAQRKNDDNEFDDTRKRSDAVSRTSMHGTVRFQAGNIFRVIQPFSTGGKTFIYDTDYKIIHVNSSTGVLLVNRIQNEWKYAVYIKPNHYDNILVCPTMLDSGSNNSEFKRKSDQEDSGEESEFSNITDSDTLSSTVGAVREGKSLSKADPTKCLLPRLPTMYRTNRSPRPLPALPPKTAARSSKSARTNLLPPPPPPSISRATDRNTHGRILDAIRQGTSLSKADPTRRPPPPPSPLNQMLSGVRALMEPMEEDSDKNDDNDWSDSE